MNELDAYSLRDLQHFSHILGIFESHGVSEIPFMRQAINDKLYSLKERKRWGKVDRKQRIRKKMTDKEKRVEMPPQSVCSECNTPMRRFLRTEEDGTPVLIDSCGKCAFSKILET